MLNAEKQGGRASANQALLPRVTKESAKTLMDYGKVGVDGNELSEDYGEIQED